MRQDVPVHGHPFRWIDRVVRLGPDACEVIKVVTAGEAPCGGPGRAGPLPAALLVEALAQAGVPLGPESGTLVEMRDIRLHRVVWPGDRLRITATVAARLGDLLRIRSRAVLAAPDATPVAEGEFTIKMPAARGRGRP